MKTIKTKAKTLLEQKAFNLFFLLRMFSEIPRYFSYFSLTKSKKISQLINLDIGNYKTSETLFVMGSGASINELGEDEWQIIKKKDSLGINFWLIHQHVPTYYMLEAGEDLDRFNTMIRLLEIKTKDYSNIPFILKNPENNFLDISRLPNILRKNCYSAYELTIPGSLEESLDPSTKLINFLRVQRIKNLLLFKRASISQALSFALKMKYKNIVLCGVDLNNVKYFYEDDTYTKQNLPIPKKMQAKSIHKTFDPQYGQITIEKIIFSINEYLLKPNNVNLYIGSKKSALYPTLEYYFNR